MTDKMKSFVKGILLGLFGHPLPQGKEPVAYLYNGVRLPKLPEWDETAYPYAVICYMTAYEAIYDYPIYLAKVSNTEFWSYDGEIGVQGDLYCVTDENGAWGEWQEGGAHTSDLLWANHDVHYAGAPEEEMGRTLFLEETNPVPVGETPPKRLKGHSYNGVVLPAPPEYDAEKYPYALVVHNGKATGYPYEFRAYSSEAAWSTTAGIMHRFGSAAYFKGKCYGENACGIVPATWCYQASGDDGNSTKTTETVIWANFTGKYNGNVYWETSAEPTPVYE
jgi:hypothetical protein